MGGEVQMMVLGSAALLQIRAGKVRALAVLSEERWRELPDVPTALETGDVPPQSVALRSRVRQSL
jgi:tripartite-type tricarboxylate transporter receptor subunit TctC